MTLFPVVNNFLVLPLHGINIIPTSLLYPSRGPRMPYYLNQCAPDQSRNNPGKNGTNYWDVPAHTIYYFIFDPLSCQSGWGWWLGRTDDG